MPFFSPLQEPTEVLLITDDSVGQNNLGEFDGSSSLTAGTKVSLSAQDVLDFTDANNTLYVSGNDGDVVQIGSGWSNGTTTSDGYSVYTQNIGGTTVTLMVELGLTVDQTNPV